MDTNIFRTFVYNPAHGVVVCRTCGTCIGAQPRAQERHLRSQPHQLCGETLKAVLGQLSGYVLRSDEELRANKPVASVGCPAIEHLAVYEGWRCVQGCEFATRSLREMRRHAATHGVRKAMHHSSSNPLWQACQLQTYFTAGGRIDYFVVVVVPPLPPPRTTTLLPRSEDGDGQPGERGHEDESVRGLFDSLADDCKHVRSDLEREARVVDGFGDSRSARIPWLERTGFVHHLQGLDGREIQRSHNLAAGDSDNADERRLRRVLAAATSLLHNAYKLCKDTSPNRKLTQQRAVILSDFYPVSLGGVGGKGKVTAFRAFKNPPTIARYFRKAKQMLAYVYRVAYHDDGHFTRREPSPGQAEEDVLPLPQGIIQLSPAQLRALADIDTLLPPEDEADKASPEGDSEPEADSPLCLAVQRLFFALICHRVGGAPFRSPVLSFCAMLSRSHLWMGEGEMAREGEGDLGVDNGDVAAAAGGSRSGGWMGPGSYNGYLSALV